MASSATEQGGAFTVAQGANGYTIVLPVVQGPACGTAEYLWKTRGCCLLRPGISFSGSAGLSTGQLLGYGRGSSISAGSAQRSAHTATVGAGRTVSSCSSSRGAGMQRRFSSSAPPSLKTQLRELYKRVHPDQFQDHPEAQAANTASFQMLSEYLAAAKQGGELGRTAGLPYKFVFYLKSQAKPSSEPSGDAEPVVSHPLQHVALTLPPPARMEASISDELPRSTRKALAKLLDACGLENEFSGGLDGEARGTRLREFMPAAADLARKRVASHFGARHHLSVMRTALNLGRKVSVGWGGSLRARGLPAQVEALQRVAAALDLLPDVDLAGVPLMLGDSCGLDPLGQMWLPAHEGAQEWASELVRMDVERCRELRERLERVKRLEAAVASALGLAMVFSSPDVMASNAYRRLLEALAAAEAGPLRGGALAELPLRVQPGDGSAEVTEEQEEGGHSAASGGFEVNEHSGLVSVPVDAVAKQVLQYIQANSGRALAALQRQRREGQQRQRLLAEVQKRLRLRRLSGDHELPADRVQSCCARLLQHSGVLVGLFEGVSLRVSYLNQVAVDGSYVDIAWDFEI